MQPLQFASVLSFSDDSTYTLTVTTKNFKTVYVYRVFDGSLTTTINSSVPVVSVLTGSLVVEVVDYATDFVIVELSGNHTDHSVTPYVESTMTTAGQVVSVHNQNTFTGLPEVGYLSYSYRANINIAESWEGACLMLKPAHLTLSDLYTDVDNAVLDSGQIFQ